MYTFRKIILSASCTICNCFVLTYLVRGILNACSGLKETDMQPMIVTSKAAFTKGFSCPKLMLSLLESSRLTRILPDDSNPTLSPNTGSDLT